MKRYRRITFYSIIFNLTLLVILSCTIFSNFSEKDISYIKEHYLHHRFYTRSALLKVPQNTPVVITKIRYRTNVILHYQSEEGTKGKVAFYAENLRQFKNKFKSYFLPMPLDEYLKTLRERYQEPMASLIFAQQIVPEMTTQMVLESWGEPDRIEQISNSFGETEKWTYGEKASEGYYLYFKNGKLTRWYEKQY